MVETRNRSNDGSRNGSSNSHRDKSFLAVWAPIPLRLIVGIGFMLHGYAKLAKGPESFAHVLQLLGVPSPHLMSWITILIELLCGLAVVLGTLIPLVSLPMATVLLVAMVTVHMPYGFSSIKLKDVVNGEPQFGKPGYECDLLYIACLASLLATGSGPLSIDALLSKRRSAGRTTPKI